MNEWVWSNGGMILTVEDWSTGRKTLYSVGGRWMIEYGAMVEWYWQGKTEVQGEKHYTAWVVDGWMSMEQWWNDTDGITSAWGKICPSSTFSTSNLTWRGQRLNHSACGQRSRMNFPSNYGMAESAWNLTIFMFCAFIVWYWISHTDFRCPSCLSFVSLLSSSVLHSATIMLYRCDSTQSM